MEIHWNTVITTDLFLLLGSEIYLFWLTDWLIDKDCSYIHGNLPTFIIGLFQKKIQTEVEDILFWKPPSPWNFSFFTLPLEILDKTKLNPWIFHKIVLDPSEISTKAKNKVKTPLEILHYFLFLVTLENSILFLIKPWKCQMQFFWYPWKFHILNPPSCRFFPK